MARDSIASLAPGFRFHPTDEELIRYYLKRKVCNKPLRIDAISVVDIYKSEPWDLPDKSKLKSRDLEWYFFSALDKKNGNGSKTNRATDRGYWKTTGKDREIRNGSRTVGMKKTLVYHQGRAPRGERTNWVMHEYRLAEEELLTAGVAQDAFVLCRVFQKSGSGPKNGEQYGAPFVEEEWEDDELALGPEQDALKVEVASGEDIYLNLDDFDQKFDTLPVHENHPASLKLIYGESSKHIEPDSFSDSRNCIDSGYYVNSGNHMDSGNYVEPGIWDEQSRDFGELEEDQKPLIETVGKQYGSIMPEDQVASGIVEQNMVNVHSDRNDFAAETSYNANPDMNYLLDELYKDANNDILFGNDMYLEANDLLNTPEASFNFEEYLTFSDTEDNDAQHLSFDTSQFENENFVLDREDLAQKQPAADGLGLASTRKKSILEEQDKKEASFSKEDKKAGKFESDSKYSFLRKASHMLDHIPAPPAFASEFPAKEAAIRLHSAAQSSGFNINAGMMRISNMKLAGPGLDWSYNKNGNVNFVLCFGVVENNDGGSARKLGSGLSRGMFFFMCFWVLILSVSFKIGICICAK